MSIEESLERIALALEYLVIKDKGSEIELRNYRNDNLKSLSEMNGYDELSIRTQNTLRNLKIRYLPDLLNKTESELRGLNGIGLHAMAEIRRVLEKNNLGLEEY